MKPFNSAIYLSIKAACRQLAEKISPFQALKGASLITNPGARLASFAWFAHVLSASSQLD
jgi:hypothetical protein